MKLHLYHLHVVIPTPSLSTDIHTLVCTNGHCSTSHPHSGMDLMEEAGCAVEGMFPAMCCTSDCTRLLYLALPTLILLDSTLIKRNSCLWLWWQLHSIGQCIHMWTFTSFALNPTWMKPAHSINSAHHVCLESWKQFMPRKLQAVKNTFDTNLKVLSLTIHLHSYSYTDSKCCLHLVQ